MPVGAHDPDIAWRSLDAIGAARVGRWLQIEGQNPLGRLFAVEIGLIAGGVGRHPGRFAQYAAERQNVGARLVGLVQPVGQGDGVLWRRAQIAECDGRRAGLAFGRGLGRAAANRRRHWVGGRLAGKLGIGRGRRRKGGRRLDQLVDQVAGQGG